jgi:hypothetical protein
MPIRAFRTADGVVWQVWNVIPGLRDTSERRVGYDRRSPEPVFRYTGPERRVMLDRRKPPPLLSPRLAAGWLAFECPTEKRRLAPIPAHWDQLTDAELERLCQSAARVAVQLAPPAPPGPADTG